MTRLTLDLMLLGSGVRLFQDHVADQVALRATRVVESPAVTHLRFEVEK